MPDTSDFVKTLRAQFDPKYNQDYTGVNFNVQPSAQKPSFYNYSNDTLDMKYDTLSNGDRVERYENYLPGSDNNERLAQQQTTGEKWANGITKALSKTGSAIAGGTVGMVYGLGAALSEGSRSAIYDNDFSNKLNDWDTKLNYQLPNYYTKQEQEKNLFGQMGTANFWSDKFLGGLSFTAGAIISEAIWAAATGGTSLAARGAMLGTKLARWGSKGIGEAGVIAGMSKYKSLVRGLLPEATEVGQISKALPNALGKAGEVFSVTGRLARSAGYEASVESLQFKKEAEENFYNNFSDINGREPNAEDIAKFNTDLEDSSNGVFATNMAILMPSNLITLGHVLDIKSPIKLGLTEFLDKKAFGYGLAKTAEGTFTKLAPTTAQKVTKGLFNYAVKPGITEGVFEEGLQGVTTKFGNRWIENTYDTKNTAQTFDSIDAMGKSMAEQYGTREGLVDVGLGVLIGMFGSSMNVRGENKQREKELDYKLSVSNTFADQNLFAKNLINHKIQTANRITGFSEEAKAEEEKGNIVKSQLNRNSAILSFINSKQVLGESLSDTSKEVRQSLNSLTEEQWGDAGITPENIEQEKEDRINEFESLSKQWKSNKTYWTYMLGGKLAGEQNLETTGLEKSLGGSFSKNAAIIEAFTWQSTIGENSHTLLRDAQEVVGRELGTEQAKTLSIKNSLLRAGAGNEVTIKRLEAEHNANIIERDKLTEDIVKLNSAPKETEGNKVIGNKLLEAQKRLLEVNKNISDIQRESQEIADKINITEAQEQNLNSIDVSQAISGTTISGSDLLKLSENINKFKATLDFIATSNPQRYQYLDGILKEYSDAEEVFLQHKATQKAILSPDFKIDRIEGWIRGKVSAKKAMNENTQEWLQDALDSYTKNKAEFISDLLSSEEATNIVSESDYEDFTENDNVSDEILAKIANKKEKGEVLDSKENEIYNSREKEINEIIAKSNTETKPKSEEQILKEKIAQLEQERDDKIANIEPITVENNSDQTEEIKKLEEEYNQKIKDLQPETRTNLEIYRDVLENLISNVYRGVNHMPSNAEEARATKPTEEDIKKYRELRKSKQTKSAEYKELENKLKSWKLLASAVDENYTSIAEIINLIEQLETEQQKEDTKVIVTEDEAKTVLRDDTGTSEKRVDQSQLQNQNGHATVHNVKNSGKYTFSHIEAAYIVNQLGGDFEVKRGKKTFKNPNLRDLEVGDIISIDNMSFTFTFGGTLEMKISEFEARQQVLNMYVNPVRTGSWTYLDVYTTKGNERVKMPSQFNENIEQKEIYNEKEGNELSLHIDNADGWNDTEKGGTKEGLKLYFKNKKGDNISVAKAGKDAKSTSFDQRFENMRLVAYDRWIAQGKPNTLDLGITATIDNIFFGSAELLMDEEGRVLNVPITESEAENIITAKGYVLNGEIKLDREVKDVNLTFAGKLSKDNPTLKVPIIVFKKGVHNIAFPITMNKTNTPVEFDSILKSGKTPNEIVLAINEAIIKNNIKTPKLVYADLTNEEKLEITREAFTNKQSYVSADTLASSGYAKSNLSGDALINIDLSNLDNAISSPKIRIDLDSIELGKITDFKNETKTEIENYLNGIAKEIENVNLTQYVDKKGNAIENNFTDFIGENPTVEVNNQLNKVTNLNILRGYLALAPKSFRMLFGEDKINFAKNTILRYDSFSKQTNPKDEDKKSGEEEAGC